METDTPQPAIISRQAFIASLQPQRAKPSPNLGILSLCALIILLLVQIIFWQQNTFFKHPKIYAIANATQHLFTQQTLHINAPGLARIDQHMTTEAATTTGTLQITGLLRNAGHIPITTPLLRIALENHQGKSIAARNLTPTEYSPGQTLTYLEPGKRYTFTINIQQPGKIMGYRLSLR